MTFKEMVKQIHKECGAGVTYQQTMRIMVTAVRVVLEEICLNPETAYVEFTSLGKFYAINREYSVPNLSRENGEFKHNGRTKMRRWGLRFRPYPNIAKVINGDMHMRDLKIASIPLYPEEPLLDPNRKQIKFTTDQTMNYQIHRRMKNEKKKSQRRVNIASRLPEDD